VRLSPLGTSATNWPVVPVPDDGWWMWSSRWNENWQGKLKYSEKTCPSASLSTTNPTLPDPGSNPGRRSRKPATNRLSYGTTNECLTPNVFEQVWIQFSYCLVTKYNVCFSVSHVCVCHSSVFICCAYYKSLCKFGRGYWPKFESELLINRNLHVKKNFSRNFPKYLELPVAWFFILSPDVRVMTQLHSTSHFLTQPSEH
jgi:hypothetical protein